MANEPYVERTTIERPAGERREEVRVTERRSGSATGWWIAALVAVIAVAGLFFMYNQNSTSALDLQAARDGGRTEALAANAQSAANQASEASARAASSVADATRAAAERSAAAAEQTAKTAQDAAASATDAATDAVDTTTERPN